MDIVTSKEQEFSVVAINGRLDAVTSPELEKSCSALIEQGQNRLILDLTALDYVSSAGLRSVLAAAKKAKAAGGTLVLCGLSGLVQEVFTISGFDSFLPVYDDVAAACQAGNAR